MEFILVVVVPLLQTFLSGVFATESPCDDLLVQTSSFSVQGTLASDSVRKFLGVPYAEPPLGFLRFRPPVTKQPYDSTLDATAFGPSCLQYDTGAPSVGTEYFPASQIRSGESEDCLTLNIWTPRQDRIDESLPVMIWIPGGALLNGGSSPLNYDGTSFVENQNVIIVTINYRVNIFGFPAAAALDGRHHNVGLLDQRMAVEWVFNHIHAFGGNPTRMTLFGQSAGGSSTDFYSYAWYDDPLVDGFIIQSGAVGNTQITYSDGTSNFSYVAEQVGCGSEDKDEEFRCMQKADAETILEVYETYSATENGGMSLGFGASVDEETIFSNWTERRERGLVANRPALIGNTNNEYASLYSPFTLEGPNQTEIHELSKTVFECPAAIASAARVQLGILTWRYWYFGIFPNLNPLPWLGAYHSSEIPIVFGTSNFSGQDTEVEIGLSKYMQGAWAAFAKDPEHGLEEYGWPQYDVGGQTLVLLGRDNATTAEFGNPSSYDQGCS
ncbi:alpha/beta-hydrolase [Lojkania enalia]|uniref:Carboxylic ester hydrolase n=1 Tax=Lojkania enalia TaxID=147567 RepID=A0A9P4MY62_9PLEO|nr:alpha/beta-hydrolase [Didymosphaeria enalia]